jgi:hypothetical protein
MLANAPGSTASMLGLKIFFGLVELLVIVGGIYLLRNRKKFFGYKGSEGDTYASANLRMIMVVLVWIHAVILIGLMILGLH